MILVGAPSWRREWMIREWCQAVDVAAKHAGVDVSFVLELDVSDKPTDDMMKLVSSGLRRSYVPLWVRETPQSRERINWNLERFQHMVCLRNTLLSFVRSEAPDYFLSLDTDVILHPHALANLLESTSLYDVVGGKCFMTPSGTWAPSWAVLHNGASLLRYDSDMVMPVEVVMAIKLMNPKAYSIDYELHELGEDIGISKAWRRSGLRIGWDGRVCNKHVLSPDRLNIIDPRCQF